VHLQDFFEVFECSLTNLGAEEPNDLCSVRSVFDHGNVLTFDMLSRWSRLYLQSYAPTNPHGYGSTCLWSIYKEGLCRSNGDINRLMMVMMMPIIAVITLLII
jgi:hypothetical protein